jgi:autotransporter-associated beta strand protein
LANAISGTGAMTFPAGSTLTLTGTNTMSGTTTVAAGSTLQVGDGTSGSLVGGVANGGALIYNSPANFAVSGVISGAGTLTKQGTGTVTLSGTNTYTGETAVSAGTLAVNNTAGLGATTGGTTVASGATLNYVLGDPSTAVSYAAEPLTLAGAGVGGLGALLISGNRATLKPAITLTGDTVIGTTAAVTQGWLSCVDGSCTNTLSTAGYGLTFGANGGMTVTMAINGSGRVVHEGTGWTSLVNQNLQRRNSGALGYADHRGNLRLHRREHGGGRRGQQGRLGNWHCISAKRRHRRPE